VMHNGPTDATRKVPKNGSACLCHGKDAYTCRDSHVLIGRYRVPVR